MRKMADTVTRYFESELFLNLSDNRKDIVSYGNKKGSWDEVASITMGVYEKLLSE